MSYNHRYFVALRVSDKLNKNTNSEPTEKYKQVQTKMIVVDTFSGKKINFIDSFMFWKPGADAGKEV